VETDGAPSCGGDQRRFADAELWSVGCGVIAAMDTLIYLGRSFEDARSPFFEGFPPDPCPQAVYELYAERLRRGFLPIIPRFGVNGLALAGGMNRFFRRYKLPYSASWGVPAHRLRDAVSRMLEADIPAVVAVGPNFPRVWRKEKLAFYTPEGRPAAAASAHYVTALALDGDLLTVASWGGRYVLSLEEHAEYARRHSLPFLSSALDLRHR